MGSQRHAVEVAEIARDLDMVVFKLEREPADDRDDLEAERHRLRKELEELRDRLNDLVRSMQ